MTRRQLYSGIVSLALASIIFILPFVFIAFLDWEKIELWRAFAGVICLPPLSTEFRRKP